MFDAILIFTKRFATFSLLLLDEVKDFLSSSMLERPISSHKASTSISEKTVHRDVSLRSWSSPKSSLVELNTSANSKASADRVLTNMQRRGRVASLRQPARMSSSARNSAQRKFSLALFFEKNSLRSDDGIGCEVSSMVRIKNSSKRGKAGEWQMPA